MPTKAVFCGGSIHLHNLRHTGGSVLLNKGGAGSGSSYSSIDDYIETTGRNPLGNKLSKLLLKPKHHNIKFEF